MEVLLTREIKKEEIFAKIIFKLDLTDTGGFNSNWIWLKQELQLPPVLITINKTNGFKVFRKQKRITILLFIPNISYTPCKQKQTQL